MKAKGTGVLDVYDTLYIGVLRIESEDSLNIWLALVARARRNRFA